MSERLSDEELAHMRDMDRRANEGECDTDDLLAMLPDVVRAVDELRAARVVVEAAMAWQRVYRSTGPREYMTRALNERARLSAVIDALAGAK